MGFFDRYDVGHGDAEAFATAARWLGGGSALLVSHSLMVAKLTPESRESCRRLRCWRPRARRNAAGLNPCTPARTTATSSLGMIIS